MASFGESLSRLRDGNVPVHRRPRSIISAALITAGVAGVVGRRRRGRQGAAPSSHGASSGAGDAAAAGAAAAPRTAAGGAPDGERQWTCQCGQEYRVQGVDRHRVYWLAGADAGDPVLEADCPKCGTALPREHEHPESVPG